MAGGYHQYWPEFSRMNQEILRGQISITNLEIVIAQRSGDIERVVSLRRKLVFLETLIEAYRFGQPESVLQVMNNFHNFELEGVMRGEKE